MRINRGKLTFKAIAVLAEAVEACSKGPVKANAGIRFALAWLYATASKPDRSIYDCFFRTIQRPDDKKVPAGVSDYMRNRDAHGWLKAISRRAGIELNVELNCELRIYLMPQGEREAYLRSPARRFGRPMLRLTDQRTLAQKNADELSGNANESVLVCRNVQSLPDESRSDPELA